MWFNSTSGKTISLFDQNGKPLSPPEGYNFGGKLGFMQGIIVTPSGDVWALDFTNDKVVYMPQGDPTKAKFYCESTNGKPNKDSPCKLNGPFGLAIDQQDRIWISNAIGDTVTRFPAADQAKLRYSRLGATAARAWRSTARATSGSPNGGFGIDTENQTASARTQDDRRMPRRLIRSRSKICSPIQG